MQHLTDRSVLEPVDLFRGLDEGALDQALVMAQRRRIRASAAAFEQGQPADAFFVLVSGRLKVSQVTAAGQQVVVRFIGPRDFFGCVAMYGGRRYPATAMAVEDSLALAWTRAAAAQLIAREPQMALNAMGAVAERLQETQARVRQLATERVDQRIAHALVRLAGQAGRRDPEGVRIGFRLSRQDIAEMAGTTLHTVSRTLSAWEEDGIVLSGRQSVVIRDPAALEALAGEPARA
jgi:CRP-like cAMP-binding protein